MADNFGFHFKMEGEALDALKRLAGFSTTDYFKIISGDYGSTARIPTASGVFKMPTYDETPLSEAMRSYKSAWTGGIGGKAASAGAGSKQGNLSSSDFITPTHAALVDGAITSVYRAVKRAFFGASKIGKLTGNTVASMKTWQRGNTLFAGIEGGAWPQGGSGSFMSFINPPPLPFNKIGPHLLTAFESKTGGKWGENRKKYIEELLGGNLSIGEETRHVITLSHIFTRESRIKKLKRTKSGIGGNVIMKWGVGGLDIIWPKDAKGKLFLKDFHIGAEPYSSKHYGKPGQTIKDRMFAMSGRFVTGTVIPYLEQYIETLWLGPGQKSTDRSRAPEDDVIDRALAGDVKGAQALMDFAKQTQPGAITPTEFTTNMWEKEETGGRKTRRGQEGEYEGGYIEDIAEEISTEREAGSFGLKEENARIAAQIAAKEAEDTALADAWLKKYGGGIGELSVEAIDEVEKIVNETVMEAKRSAVIKGKRGKF